MSEAQSPRERAEKLLSIHQGHCVVLNDSDLAAAFRDMKYEGLVTINEQISYAYGTTLVINSI